MALKMLRNVYNYLFFLVETPLVPITQEGEDLLLADLPQFVNQTMSGAPDYVVTLLDKLFCPTDGFMV